MTPKNKRLLILTIRNFTIAISGILAILAFGVGILFLNDYFGSAMVGLSFAGISMLVYLIWMSISIAKNQVAIEEIRSKQVMDTLKQERF
jgi:hypothetical protein